MSPLLVALTSEASNLAMLMLGFGGFGLATFSVGMRVGQIVEAAWWKGKLQEALTSTREPQPSRQMSLVRERRELDDGPPPWQSPAPPTASAAASRAFSVSTFPSRRARGQTWLAKAEERPARTRLSVRFGLMRVSFEAELASVPPRQTVASLPAGRRPFPPWRPAPISAETRCRRLPTG